MSLFGEIETLEETFITVLGRFLEIIKKTPAFADHLEEAAAAVVVFFVNFEVACELADLLTEESDLHFWTTSIAFVDSEFFNDGGFFVCL